MTRIIATTTITAIMAPTTELPVSGAAAVSVPGCFVPKRINIIVKFHILIVILVYYIFTSYKLHSIQLLKRYPTLSNINANLS